MNQIISSLAANFKSFFLFEAIYWSKFFWKKSEREWKTTNKQTNKQTNTNEREDIISIFEFQCEHWIELFLLHSHISLSLYFLLSFYLHSFLFPCVIIFFRQVFPSFSFLHSFFLPLYFLPSVFSYLYFLAYPFFHSLINFFFLEFPCSSFIILSFLVFHFFSFLHSFYFPCISFLFLHSFISPSLDLLLRHSFISLS